MNFGNSALTWLLIVPLLLTILILWSTREKKRRLLLFSESTILSLIYPQFRTFRKKQVRAGALSVLIVFLLVLTLLRPQWGFIWKESKRKGVDIVVAVDVSESMLAADVSPSRLERARYEILDLLEHLQGDRIGLVAFAGVAFIQSPLTVDYGTFRLFLNEISPELIPIQGTNIEGALEKSIAAFYLTTNNTGVVSKDKREKAIILITDGESFDGDIERVSKRAKEQGIRIYVLGIGSTEGAPIPTGAGYKKDRDGNIVVTRLNPEVLKSLALRTEGIFVNAISSDNDTKAIYEMGIKKTLLESSIEGGRAKRWNEYYQLPLFLAILLMILPKLSILFRRKRKSGSPQPSRIIKASVGIFLFFTPLWGPRGEAFSQTVEGTGKEAREAFEKGDFEGALLQFKKGTEKKPDDYRFKIGEGSSYYRLGKFNESKTSFLEAATKSADPLKKAEALFNTGNSLVQTGEYQEAIKSYEGSLKLNPTDQETKDNLEYVKRLLQEQKKEEEKKNEENKDKDKNNEKNDQSNTENKNSQDQEEEKQEQSHSADSKSQDKKEEEKEEEEKKNSESSSPEEEKAQSKKQEEKDSQQENKKEENRSESGSEGSKEENSKNEPTPTIIDNVEESREPFLEYRKRKAIQGFKAERVPPPEKDW